MKRASERTREIRVKKRLRWAESYERSTIVCRSSERSSEKKKLVFARHGHDSGTIDRAKLQSVSSLRKTRNTRR